MPAHDLEAIVTHRAAALLVDQMQLHDLVVAVGGDAAAVNDVIRAADVAAAVMRSGSAGERTKMLQALDARVALREHHLEVQIAPSSLLRLLGMAVEPDEEQPIINLSCETARVRRGHELRLVIPGTGSSPVPTRERNEKLVALIAEAQAARALVLGSPDRSLNRIAADAGRCRTRLGKLVGLSCLAPDIVSAIVKGRQPASLSHRALLDMDLALGWQQQRTQLGFA